MLSCASPKQSLVHVNIHVHNMVTLSFTLCLLSVFMCSVDPPSLDNGNVTITSTIIGSMAVYSCDDGYRFSTSDTNRICESDGRWSNQDIACEGKLVMARITSYCYPVWFVVSCVSPKESFV